jgi:hypothetical protein
MCCDTTHMPSVAGRTTPVAQDACQEDDMMDIEAAIRALEAEVIGIIKKDRHADLLDD